MGAGSSEISYINSARPIARRRSNGTSVRYRRLATACCLNVRRHCGARFAKTGYNMPRITLLLIASVWLYLSSVVTCQTLEATLNTRKDMSAQARLDSMRLSPDELIDHWHVFQDTTLGISFKFQDRNGLSPCSFYTLRLLTSPRGKRFQVNGLASHSAIPPNLISVFRKESLRIKQIVIHPLPSCLGLNV